MSLFDRVKARLNQQTSYVVNWNRVGGLLFSKHHYSTKELMERSFIIACTAAGGFLAWNKSEERGAIPFALGASLGFVLAHAAVIYPLIHGRLQDKWNCDQRIKTIHAQLNHEDEAFALLVKQVMDKIMRHTDEPSPSIVWRQRGRMLKNLETWIAKEDRDTLSDVLKNEEIIFLLHGNSFPQPKLSTNSL